ncbi:glycosyltransferase family 2 protein [Bacillus sp. FJAT-45350]|uniref:glycosyltransferase family 2 protein n=1 Tax=Bacillus sp. FJAT-45350 TaxID=2011014 RepID=UPI000BB72F9C|nr:glycosyltransferase family 2 protein [Bacillus sp. FJAT-45350]
MTKVSVVIPAYNEEGYLGQTLAALRQEHWYDQLIVVNDGSTDRTGKIADQYSDMTVHVHSNVGKGRALQEGWKKAEGDIIVMLDADLGPSITEAKKLLEPLQYPFFDCVIGRLPSGRKKGLGLMKKRVQRLVLKRTGTWLTSPLSGQRAIRKKWIPFLLEKNYFRFGVETEMTIDLLEEGATIVEVDTNMYHRETGKDLKGFLHRGIQWIEMERSLRRISE